MTGQYSIGIKRNFSDILVVGAGPAGLSAAKTASEAGARVTVIDRSEHPGAKACAGGLTREAIALLALDPAAVQAGRRFDTLRVVTPKGSTELGSDDGAPLMVTVDRPDIQRRAIEALRDAGVSVYLGERVRHVLKGRVRTDARELGFGTLIGADGVHSVVRRTLGLDKGMQVRALQLRIFHGQAESAGVDPSLPTVWFDAARLGAGYGWAFPYDDTLRIGLGIAGTAHPKGLRALFDDWLGTLGLSRDMGRVESGTIGCGFFGYRFKNVFLAGDAAGLASPLTGEGIGQALMSGREVVREIVEPGYRSDAIALLAARHRRTLNALSGKRMSRLLDAAPYLLRIGPVRRATLRRFVY